MWMLVDVLLFSDLMGKMGNNIGCVMSIGHGENLTEYIEGLLCTRMCEIIESDAACVNRTKLSRATSPQ